MDTLVCLHHVLTVCLFVVFIACCVLINKFACGDQKKGCTCIEVEYTGQITPSNNFILSKPGESAVKLPLYKFLQRNVSGHGDSCDQCCAVNFCDRQADTSSLQDSSSESELEQRTIKVRVRMSDSVPEGKVFHETTSGTRIAITGPGIVVTTFEENQENFEGFSQGEAERRPPDYKIILSDDSNRKVPEKVVLPTQQGFVKPVARIEPQVRPAITHQQPTDEDCRCDDDEIEARVSQRYNENKDGWRTHTNDNIDRVKSEVRPVITFKEPIDEDCRCDNDEIEARSPQRYNENKDGWRAQGAAHTFDDDSQSTISRARSRHASPLTKTKGKDSVHKVISRDKRRSQDVLPVENEKNLYGPDKRKSPEDLKHELKRKSDSQNSTLDKDKMLFGKPREPTISRAGSKHASPSTKTKGKDRVDKVMSRDKRRSQDVLPVENEKKLYGPDKRKSPEDLKHELKRKSDSQNSTLDKDKMLFGKPRKDSKDLGGVTSRYKDDKMPSNSCAVICDQMDVPVCVSVIRESQAERSSRNDPGTFLSDEDVDVKSGARKRARRAVSAGEKIAIQRKDRQIYEDEGVTEATSDFIPHKKIKHYDTEDDDIEKCFKIRQPEYIPCDEICGSKAHPRQMLVDNKRISSGEDYHHPYRPEIVSTDQLCVDDNKVKFHPVPEDTSKFFERKGSSRASTPYSQDGSGRSNGHWDTDRNGSAAHLDEALSRSCTSEKELGYVEFIPCIECPEKLTPCMRDEAINRIIEKYVGAEDLSTSDEELPPRDENITRLLEKSGPEKLFTSYASISETVTSTETEKSGQSVETLSEKNIKEYKYKRRNGPIDISPELDNETCYSQYKKPEKRPSKKTYRKISKEVVVVKEQFSLEAVPEKEEEKKEHKPKRKFEFTVPGKSQSKPIIVKIKIKSDTEDSTSSAKLSSMPEKTLSQEQVKVFPQEHETKPSQTKTKDDSTSRPYYTPVNPYVPDLSSSDEDTNILLKLTPPEDLRKKLPKLECKVCENIAKETQIATEKIVKDADKGELPEKPTSDFISKRLPRRPVKLNRKTSKKTYLDRKVVVCLPKKQKDTAEASIDKIDSEASIALKYSDSDAQCCEEPIPLNELADLGFKKCISSKVKIVDKTLTESCTCISLPYSEASSPDGQCCEECEGIAHVSHSKDKLEESEDQQEETSSETDYNYPTDTSTSSKDSIPSGDAYLTRAHISPNIRKRKHSPEQNIISSKGIKDCRTTGIPGPFCGKKCEGRIPCYPKKRKTDEDNEEVSAVPYDIGTIFTKDSSISEEIYCGKKYKLDLDENALKDEEKPSDIFIACRTTKRREPFCGMKCDGNKDEIPEKDMPSDESVLSENPTQQPDSELEPPTSRTKYDDIRYSSSGEGQDNFLKRIHRSERRICKDVTFNQTIGFDKDVCKKICDRYRQEMSILEEKVQSRAIGEQNKTDYEKLQQGYNKDSNINILPPSGRRYRIYTSNTSPDNLQKTYKVSSRVTISSRGNTTVEDLTHRDQAPSKRVIRIRTRSCPCEKPTTYKVTSKVLITARGQTSIEHLPHNAQISSNPILRIRINRDDQHLPQRVEETFASSKKPDETVNKYLERFRRNNDTSSSQTCMASATSISNKTNEREVSNVSDILAKYHLPLEELNRSKPDQEQAIPANGIKYYSAGQATTRRQNYGEFYPYRNPHSKRPASQPVPISTSSFPSNRPYVNNICPPRKHYCVPIPPHYNSVVRIYETPEAPANNPSVKNIYVRDKLKYKCNRCNHQSSDEPFPSTSNDQPTRYKCEKCRRRNNHLRYE